MPKTKRHTASEETTQAVLGILVGMMLAAVGAAALALAYLMGTTFFLKPQTQVVAAVAPTDVEQAPTTVRSSTVEATAAISGIETSFLPSTTPFTPQTYTPTPSNTPSPTATATATATKTATATATTTETPIITPTDTPRPPTETPSDGLPSEYRIKGIDGYAQSLPLSCESRSAVDWARFFGIYIKEMEFQYALPFTDNPNTGFVGDPHDDRGQIPPKSYGVHAPPVARLLRDFGLNAQSYANLSFQDLRREVASGQPVIAWVIGNTWTGYSGSIYTASDGESMMVAPYEHTVIVIGYTPETVIVLDGSMIYTPSIDRFLSSWMVLNNQAVVME